jgi:hypothetical protein
MKVLTSAMLTCPFCGCDDLETSPWPADREQTEWCCCCGNPGCGVRLYAPTKEEAAKRWNRTARTRGPAYVYRSE